MDNDPFQYHLYQYGMEFSVHTVNPKFKCVKKNIYTLIKNKQNVSVLLYIFQYFVVGKLGRN